MSIEEAIKLAVENTISSTMPQYIKKYIDESLNLKMYSVYEASEITGIGYTKISNVIKKGIIPSIIDGRTYKIRHTDLLNWIENEKISSKLS